jgi:Domain of unknown function (DUF6894)
MSRYYFHLRDFTGSIFEDDEGSELPSIAAAKEHALGAIEELVAEAIRRRQEANVEAVIVADEHGTHLAAVPLLASLPHAVVGLLKHPEKMVPENRLEEYRRNADDCRHKAESATDPDDKISWLRLADAWLQMLPPGLAAGADVAGWPEASDEDSKAAH